MGVVLFAMLSLSRPVQAQDAGLTQALAEVARVATTFWHSAPDYVGRETLNQKALTLPKRKLRAGASAVEPPKPEFGHREIVSYYAISSFRSSPEALHEFREMISVDGQNITGGHAADEFRSILNGGDDKAKKALLDGFEKNSLAVAATDFGQLILLFTKANQGKYNFRSGGSALVGADRALIVDFSQSAGAEALRVAEPGKEIREPLTGQIWIREAGFMPLRITLRTAHLERSRTIRDEARVDYQPKTEGMILPASVVYRRFVNDDLHVEAVYQYYGWQAVPKQ
jgi:hypothetical protein